MPELTGGISLEETYFSVEVFSKATGKSPALKGLPAENVSVLCHSLLSISLCPQ